LLLQAEEVAAWPGLPEGLKAEVGSQQAFLCERPRVLRAPLSMRGWPKMWALAPETAQQAEASLEEPQVMLLTVLHLRMRCLLTVNP
jgi:hypothetical protein